jgi:hypothetical protein
MSKDMIQTSGSDIAEQFLPPTPPDEIPRDNYVEQVARNFSLDCQQQLVVGERLSGKTNFLAQFSRNFRDRTISYFITSNPITQHLHAYLYSLCIQLSAILKTKSPSERIRLQDLRSLFTSLNIKLAALAPRQGVHYYYVIDGIEWGLDGVADDRIIDLFPPQTSRRSPYLIFSCSSEKVSSLPERLAPCKRVEPLAFNVQETFNYLSTLERVTLEEAQKIHRKYHGIPGYIRIIRDTKRAIPTTSFDTAPAELDRLIRQQFESVFHSSAPFVVAALEFLAICPSSLPIQILAQLTESDEPTLVGGLEATALVKFDLGSNRVEYITDITQEAIKKRLGNRSKEATQKLLELLKGSYKSEELLLTLLLKEAQDYGGLQDLLTTQALLSNIESQRDISTAMKRLRLASMMAREKNDHEGLIRWTLGVAVTKAFIAHAANENEINALMAIGETGEALRRAYAMPEAASKIRLLARVYTAMKDQGSKVPKEAQDELKTMAETLDVENLDKEIVEEIAFDLLPIIPDFAVSLLDKITAQGERHNIIEVVSDIVATGLRSQGEEDVASLMVDRNDLKSVSRLLPGWLHKMPFPELVNEVKNMSSTKAKEFFIRQWCRQNSKASDIVAAVDLWLDTVISDKKFVVTLRSLRHISDVLVNIEINQRRQLIEHLMIPAFSSIGVPTEEWVRFRLNLAEALFPIDPQSALDETRLVQNSIFQLPLDLDVRAFCLARLRVAISRVSSTDASWAREVAGQFQQCFDSLLDNSADQLELIRDTLQTLVDLDPADALLVALHLNSESRRVNAVRIVLETSMRQRGDRDLSDLITQALSQLDDGDRDSVLARISSGFNSREFNLSRPNLDTLLCYCQRISTPNLRAWALGNLAALFNHDYGSDAALVMEQAIGAWRAEDNLLMRLSLAFDLVATFAEIDRDRAKIFYDEVKLLHMQPGSSLAIGELGPMYKEVLDLAIRSITLQDVSQSGELMRTLEGLISRIPARDVRIELFAELAASTYRVGYKPYGDQIIRTEVVNRIEQRLPSPDRDSVIETCLPAIFEYDPGVAETTAKQLPYFISNRAWYSVILWSLTHSFLGDHDLEPDSLRVPNDYVRFQRVLIAADKLNYDISIYNAVRAIASSIEASFLASQIDLTQALNVLKKLDELSTAKLPDLKNIRHKGFVILTQSATHRIRTALFHKLRDKRGMSQKDIGQKWQVIIAEAEKITNIADRTFVLSTLAQDINQNDHIRAIAIAEEAYNLALKIPTVADRASRLEGIAESWNALGEKTNAQFVLDIASDLLQQLRGTSRDDQLRLIAQTAYKIQPDLADEIVSRLDARLSVGVISPGNTMLSIEKLVQNPAKLISFTQKQISGAILSQSANRLLSEYASNRGSVPQTGTLEDWLVKTNEYGPRATLDVSHWVIESLNRRQTGYSTTSRIEALLKTAEFVHELAKWISTIKLGGIPESVEDSFPGLNSKIEVFRAGEVQRARSWVQNWLSQNANGYLKICDPYFGIEEFEFLRYIPYTCKVLIITTDKNLNVGGGIEPVKRALESYWLKITAQLLPATQLMIVPQKLEDKFHDRAIVTEGAGLQTGQSLNGLGHARGTLTILPREDARELEKTYIDEMLNQGTWFMENNISPSVIALGVLGQ